MESTLTPLPNCPKDGDHLRVSLNESATRAYITGFSGTAPNWIGDGYLYILDISDPANPTELGRYVFQTRNVDVSIARPTRDDALVVLADHAWSPAPCGILHILDTSRPGLDSQDL